MGEKKKTTICAECAAFHGPDEAVEYAPGMYRCIRGHVTRQDA